MRPAVQVHSGAKRMCATAARRSRPPRRSRRVHDLLHHATAQSRPTSPRRNRRAARCVRGARHQVRSRPPGLITGSRSADRADPQEHSVAHDAREPLEVGVERNLSSGMQGVTLRTNACGAAPLVRWRGQHLRQSMRYRVLANRTEAREARRRPGSYRMLWWAAANRVRRYREIFASASRSPGADGGAEARISSLAICETLGSERGQTCSGVGRVRRRRRSARVSRAGNG